MKKINITIESVNTAMSSDSKKETFHIDDTDELLTLMELYLSDWQHRDTLFWKQIYTCFFASLIVTILPFMDLWGLHFPPELPNWIFPAIGIAMSVMSIFVSFGYSARLKALSGPYQDLIEKLPEAYRRKTIKKMYPGFRGKLLSVTMTRLISIVMFLALIAIGICLLCLQ